MGVVTVTNGAQVAGQGSGHLRTHLARFAVVGGATTVLHLGLFTALRLVWPAQGANVLALVAATVVNTHLNRVWTFGGQSGRRGAAREQAQGLLVFLLTWAATAGGLAILTSARPYAGPPSQVLAVAAGTAVSTAARFVAMRYWIFAARQPGAAGRQVAASAPHRRP